MDIVISPKNKEYIKRFATLVLNDSISDDKLVETILNAADKIRNAQSHMTLRENDAYFVVKDGAQHKRISFIDIIYIETNGRKLLIHTVDEDILCNGNLRDIEKASKGKLFRTHRAYLVNMSYVLSYDAKTITLSRGQAFVSKGKYAGFCREIEGLSER